MTAAQQHRGTASLPTGTRKKLLRIVDANFNRATEGLRVLEDICRFLLDHRLLSNRCKRLRHEIKDQVIEYFPLLAACRDTAADVGRDNTIASEQRRAGIRDMVMANAKRAAESVRVLEEVFKLLGAGAVKGDRKGRPCMKQLRYRVYIIEKDILRRV